MHPDLCDDGIVERWYSRSSCLSLIVGRDSFLLRVLSLIDTPTSSLNSPPLIMSKSKPSTDVMRYVKQVYTHLKIRDKIPGDNVPVSQLSNDIHRMQLLWQTDPAELKHTVLGFLNWKPPNNKEKTLEQFVERLENAISSFCFGTWYYFLTYDTVLMTF